MPGTQRIKSLLPTEAIISQSPSDQKHPEMTAALRLNLTALLLALFIAFFIYNTMISQWSTRRPLFCTRWSDTPGTSLLARDFAAFLLVFWGK
jgi:hypothetical protein